MLGLVLAIFLAGYEVGMRNQSDGYVCVGNERALAERFSRPIRRLKLPVRVHVDFSASGFRADAMRMIRRMPVPGVLEFSATKRESDVTISMGDCGNHKDVIIAGCFDRHSGNIHLTRYAMLVDNTVEHELLHLVGFSHDDAGMYLEDYRLKNKRVTEMLKCAYR